MRRRKMEDLDIRIRRLSDLDRVALVQELVRMDDVAAALARGATRAKRGSVARERAEQARADRARLGGIIYFLRFRSPATGATSEDRKLCEMLAEKLRAKGQWEGEYSK
jgi:hypothetical protein